VREMAGVAHDAESFRVIRAGTRDTAFELMESIQRGTALDGLAMTAVVQGTLDGLVDWMVAKLGGHTAYEILQRRADALASRVIKT